MDSPTTGSWHTWQPKWRERLLNSDLRSKLTLSKAPQRGWKTRAGHSAVCFLLDFILTLLRSQVPWLEKQHRSLQSANYSALHLGVTATLQLLQALRNPKVQIKKPPNRRDSNKTMYLRAHSHNFLLTTPPSFKSYCIISWTPCLYRAVSESSLHCAH